METLRVPILLVGTSENLRTSQRRRHCVTFDITVDSYLSACTVNEWISESRSEVILYIPLEIVKEIRERKSDDADELVLIYGNEFNLRLFEFKTGQKDQEKLLENFKREIRYQSEIQYSEKIDRWISREYFRNSGKRFDLKQFKAFTSRTFVKKMSLAGLERKLNRSTISTGRDITESEFVKIVRSFLYDHQIFNQLSGGSQKIFYASLNDGCVSNQPKEDRYNEAALPGKDSKGSLVRRTSSVPAELQEVGIGLKPMENRTSSDHFSLDLMGARLSFESHMDLLYSTSNSALNPELLKIYQDMNQPLSEYYISSSHNTYLTGSQYSSESSVEAYARCLRQGCRCIEIDVWDGPKDTPVVTHGMTLTSKILLEEVLRTIKEHAFVKSCYPVIISIENHCNCKQQNVMARLILATFGPMLLTKLDPKQVSLPSPEALKGKIILKCRKLPDSFAPGKYDNDQFETIKTGKLCLSTCPDSLPNKPYLVSLTNSTLMFVEFNEHECELNSEVPVGVDSGDSKRQSIDAPELHLYEAWFYGKLAGGKTEAAVIVTEHDTAGCFLVRNSESSPHEYALCLLHQGQPRHFRIGSKSSSSSDAVSYFLSLDTKTASTIFDSLYGLVSYYKQNDFEFVINEVRVACRLTEPAVYKKERELELLDYFYPNLDRSGAENILRRIAFSGVFLVRYGSATHGKSYVISFRFENQIKHCQIQESGRNFIFACSEFPSMKSLVEFYEKECFYKDIKLLYPVGTTWYTLSLNQTELEKVYAEPGYTKVKPEIMVKATHSYESENPELLSFNEGDIIKNVLKIGDGWWRGDLHNVGEQKLFCSNFVQDYEVSQPDKPLEQLQKGTIEIGKAKLCSSIDTSAIPKYIFKMKSKKKIKMDKPQKDTKTRGNCFPELLKFQRCFCKTSKNEIVVTKFGVNSLREASEWVEAINYVANKISVKDSEHLIALKSYKVSKHFSDIILFSSTSSMPDMAKVKMSSIKFDRMKSLSETAGNSSVAKYSAFYTWYHQKALSRIYPKGTRLDSSNLNPIRFWNAGCQIVTMNFQKADKPAQWNRGKFLENGGCGYVLKPKFMRNLNSPEEVNTQLRHLKPLKIHLKIIAGRHLTKAEKGTISPFIEIEVIGVDADCKKYRSRTIADNGLNPYWDQEFIIPIKIPDLALIQFTALDEDIFGDGQVLGESTIPVKCFREDFRSIPLCNKYGEEILSTLLVYLKITPM